MDKRPIISIMVLTKKGSLKIYHLLQLSIFDPKSSEQAQKHLAVKYR